MVFYPVGQEWEPSDRVTDMFSETYVPVWHWLCERTYFMLEGKFAIFKQKLNKEHATSIMAFHETCHAKMDLRTHAYIVTIDQPAYRRASLYVILLQRASLTHQMCRLIWGYAFFAYIRRPVFA